ncbi:MULTISPECIES: hypothetical protein [unclassified Acidovorax]|uniref:hypothetical protein n=1 Tax=unclassified Acidovorax TaxID=2684926 RepID=UPI0012FBC876|nr:MULTISPECIES: hypothetical protein [unclassified Acidovorax]
MVADLSLKRRDCEKGNVLVDSAARQAWPQDRASTRADKDEAQYQLRHIPAIP